MREAIAFYILEFLFIYKKYIIFILPNHIRTEQTLYCIE